jgi:transcriptional regulator with XRE-family HTH domain
MRETSSTEKQAIEALRDEGFSKKRVSDVMGVSRSTVDKYEGSDAQEYTQGMDQSIDLMIEALPDDMSPADVFMQQKLPDEWSVDSGEEYTSEPPGKSPLKDEETKRLRVMDDYSNTSPGEFIEAFFEDFEVGVRKSFLKMQARRAERRKEIPDEEKMRSDLVEMSSGISNTTEAGYIAEEYAAEAKQYVAEADVEVFRGGPGSNGQTGGQRGSSEGSFMSPGQPQGQQGQWVQMPDGSTVYGTFVQGPNGTKQFQPLSQPGQNSGHSGADSGVKEEIRALRQELREVQSEDQGPEGFVEQVKQLHEMKEALDELDGEDATSDERELAEAIRGEFRSLRQELSNTDQRPTPESPSEMMLQRALENENASMEQMMTLADKLEGTMDPEIRQAEIERDLEMKKLEQKKERTESLMEGVNTLAKQFGEGLGSAIAASDGSTETDGGTDTDSGSDSDQSAQIEGTPNVSTPGQRDQGQAELTGDGAGTTLPRQTQTQQWECPECGEVSQQNLSTPGVECKHCDFSIMPCPDCGSPIDIPPADEVARGGCPSCGAPLMPPDEGEDQTACLSCEWVGSFSEHSGDPVECEACGSKQYVSNSPEEGSSA